MGQSALYSTYQKGHNMRSKLVLPKEDPKLRHYVSSVGLTNINPIWVVIFIILVLALAKI